MWDFGFGLKKWQSRMRDEFGSDTEDDVATQPVSVSDFQLLSQALNLQLSTFNIQPSTSFNPCPPPVDVLLKTVAEQQTQA